MEELKMPQPAVALDKASQKELIEEVKCLRQFTSLMLLRFIDALEKKVLLP